MIKIKYFIIIAIVAVGLGACAADPDLTAPDSDLSTESRVIVSLNMAIDQMVQGTESSTKSTRVASDADSDGILSDIVNLLVVQFDGVDDDTSVVNYVEYVSDMGRDPSIELIQTEDPSLVLFIANSFNTIPVTEGMLLSYVRSMGVSLSGNMETTENGILYDSSLVVLDDKDNKYFMMSDSYTFSDGLTSNATIGINMKRNVARVTINVTNSEWEAGRIYSVGVKNIPSKTLYYSNQMSEDSSLLVPASVAGTTSHFNSTSLTIDGTQSFSVTYYVPVNMRGVVSSSTLASDKPTYAPDNATYAYIKARSADYGAADYLEYTFYLGADLVKDYNLMPNTFYEYDFTFNGQGDLEDPRISYVEASVTGDYTQLKSSNCYILNPSDAASTVYIPIAPRVNEYWNDYGGDSSMAIADSALDSWEYSILWSDTDEELSINDGESELLANDIYIEKCLMGEDYNIPSLAITLGEGFSNVGNVLLAVTNLEGDILWSWHLWITDYNPYNHGITQDSPKAGIFDLDNGTGALHRYDDSASATTAYWGSGGIYEDKYIMDRNIGARSATISSASDAGHLYYQFGRKDPFPYPGKSKTVNAPAVGISYLSSKLPMSTAVANPTTKYSSSSNWCSQYEGTSSDDNYVWHDPSLTDLEAGEKSIFDPSPYGFRLPISGVWGGLTLNSVDVEGSSSSDTGYGYYFEDRNGNKFLYPVCGYISNTATSYVVTNKDNSYAIYTCATVKSLQSYTTHTYSICKTSLSSTQLYLTRSAAASLRCIEDVLEGE